MAKAAKKQVDGEIPQPDYELAVKIYRGDILPAENKVGNFSQELSTAYKAIKKNAHIQPAAAKLAFKLDKMEESQRDDFLRSLNGLLKQLKIYMPRDLLDAASGAPENENVIPTGDRPKLRLATLPDEEPDSNGDDNEDADGASEYGDISETQVGDDFDAPKVSNNAVDFAPDFEQPVAPKMPMLGQSWLNSQDGKIRYWHGGDWADTPYDPAVKA